MRDLILISIAGVSRYSAASSRLLGHPLRWTETQSRDTNENAMLTLPLLQASRAPNIVLVTHGPNMRRALAAFARAGGARRSRRRSHRGRWAWAGGLYRTHASDWLPTRSGFDMVNTALHEWLGRIGGA